MKRYTTILALAALTLSATTFVACGGDDDDTPIEEPVNPQPEPQPEPTLAKTRVRITTNITADYLQLYDTKIEAMAASATYQDKRTIEVTQYGQAVTYSFDAGMQGTFRVTSTPKSDLASIINKGQTYQMPSTDGISYYVTRLDAAGNTIDEVAVTNEGTVSEYTGRQVLANTAFFEYNTEVSISDTGHNATTTSNGSYVDPGVEVTEGDAIDLGLSVKWASTNVVTTAQFNGESYFAWGETSVKNDYTWNTYRYVNSYGALSKYSPSDGKTRLEPDDDVAHVVLGGNWRMPTKAEAEELVSRCEWVWTKMGTQNGYHVIGPNGNSIFLPAAGHLAHNTIALYGRPENYGSYGSYWTSEVLTTTGDYPYQAGAIIGFQANEVTLDAVNSRMGGCSVHAVLPE